MSRLPCAVVEFAADSMLTAPSVVWRFVS